MRRKHEQVKHDFSKAWLEKKIMCGLCNFGCCNHNSFHVEITEEEQEKYQKKFGLDLELEWQQNGCCDLLSKVEVDVVR